MDMWGNYPPHRRYNSNTRVHLVQGSNSSERGHKNNYAHTGKYLAWLNRLKHSLHRNDGRRYRKNSHFQCLNQNKSHKHYILCPLLPRKDFLLRYRFFLSPVFPQECYVDSCVVPPYGSFFVRPFFSMALNSTVFATIDSP